MKNASICFSEAQYAWTLWNQLPYVARFEKLNSVANDLALDALKLPLRFHHQHTQSLLSEPLLMQGPTGETNELYTSGRGVALIIADEEVVAEKATALYAQVAVALMAGNCVMVCVQNSVVAQQILKMVEMAQWPVGVLSLVEYDQYSQLLASDVRIVSVIGSETLAKSVNRSLAEKEGAIAPLIVELNLAKMPMAHDPKLILRYITERTRTINITAVGGNATLLELGSGAH